MKLLLILSLMLAAFGCGGICQEITAHVPQVNARLADAQRAISNLENSGVRETLSGDALAKYDEGLRLTKQGYELAVQSTALASESCSDSRSYLDMIVRGWTIVRPFIPLLIGGDGSSPSIADPLIWKEAQP